MRVVPRRNKGRRQAEDTAPPSPPPAATPDRPLAWPPPPAPLLDPSERSAASADTAPLEQRAPDEQRTPEEQDAPREQDAPPEQATLPEQATAPMPSVSPEQARPAEPGARAEQDDPQGQDAARAGEPVPFGRGGTVPSPAQALGQDDLTGRTPPEPEPFEPVPGPTLIPEPEGPPPAGPARAVGFTPPERPGPVPARGPERSTAVLPVPEIPDADRRRRARAEQRRRAAAETKRSRAARRQGLAYRERPVPEPVQAADQHRSALVIMVLTLGLLIAAVAVTGGMIASSMRTQPVTLAAPLHVYPVTQAAPGQCPAGTPGITGQSAGGVTCYRLAQGIAIHKVADLRVQRSRGSSSGYDVALTLRPVDRQAFARLTSATVGRDLAFVVRDRLITLPRVDMPIRDGKVVVTGSPTRSAADTLVRELKGR
ncbi:hypothetical protein GCM10009527_018720 [Actinomadura nitritigenes]|uniref:SecDF P1 head subdomain domain-containing protein n=1 Tax=Actinomadura nitritigenes TaxID=134602 RepID=A0ABS3RAL2_9ACTN|nr:hypothetical protein [Actinomadura nitritigenes]MBO2443241.1 hypothetical protein [Actinomadura nitritigenes]